MATVRAKPWELAGIDRRSGLGASDVGAVLGLNPWKTPVDVWLEKRGLRSDAGESEAAKWGRILEPLVAAEYARRRPGVRLMRCKTIRHERHEWAFCTPDRIALMPDGTRRLVEIKTAGLRLAHLWQGDVPASYLAQWHWQAWITGLREGDMPVLIGGQEYQEYAITYDEAMAEGVASFCGDWWARHVVMGQEPEPRDAADERKVLSALFPLHARPQFVPASGDLEVAALKLREAKALAAQAAELEEAAANKVKRLLKEAPGCEGPWGRISWKADKNGRRAFKPAFKEAETNDV